MRRTPASSGVAAGRTPAAPLGPLQLPLDYVASRLQLPVSSLLNLDQAVAEAAFPQLLERLQLPHLAQLVSTRIDERHEAKMAAKVGSAAASGGGAAQAKAEEAAYRSVFTNLLLQQSAALGFKAVVNPNLTSLAADKKLALRLLDFLAKRCFGPPPAPAPADSSRTPPAATRRPREPDSDGPATSATAAHPTLPAAARRAPSADRRSSAAPAATRDAPPNAPSRRDASRGIAAAAPASDPPPPPPARRHTSASSSVRLRSVGTDRDDDAISQPPSGRAQLQQQQQQGADAADEPYSDDDNAFVVEQASVASSYDGRFADAEFGAHEPLSPSAGRPAVAASSSSSRASSRRTVNASRNGGGGGGGSTSSVAGIRHAGDDEKSREQLLAELSDERARHHATTLQLHSLKGMYEQMLRERGEEKFGARRVTLLKAQNMQMERQLSLLSEGIDTRRTCLHELGTIVTGLEGSVREVQHEQAEAGAGGTGGALPAAIPKGQRKLRNLELSIEAAKQRLSKYHRPTLQYSAAEERFLASDAPLSAESIYSGQLTHLNLARVHELESGLAALHEQLVQAHALLSAVAAVVPAQMQLESFLQRRASTLPTSSRRTMSDDGGGDNGSDATLRLHTLLDSLRSSAFDLQSLGVLLPSHTAFPSSSTHQAPPGSQREWSWIFAIQQALKKRGVPSGGIDMLLKRATLEESITSLRIGMLERELAYHRSTQQAQAASLHTLLAQSQAILAKFHASNNALYASANRELSQCVADWQRNSTHVNVQRLLALLQSVFPCLKQLLEFRHDDTRTHAPASGSGSGSVGSAVPDLAAALQSDLDEALRLFDERMRALRERQAQLQLEVDADAEPKPGKQQRRGASDVPPAVASARNLTSSSGGRGGSTTARPASNTPPDAELPPFQF